MILSSLEARILRLKELKVLIFFTKREKDSREIEQIQAAYIDDIEIKADQYYGLRGEAICKKKC